MRSLERFVLVAWLAFALVAGQQLVLWHDIGHASEAGAGHDDGKLPAKCEQHFTCAQLAGALGSTPFVAAFIASAPPRAAAIRARAASLAPRHAFHSRAPPALLA